MTLEEQREQLCAVLGEVMLPLIPYANVEDTSHGFYVYFGSTRIKFTGSAYQQTNCYLRQISEKRSIFTLIISLGVAEPYKRHDLSGTLKMSTEFHEALKKRSKEIQDNDMDTYTLKDIKHLQRLIKKLKSLSK